MSAPNSTSITPRSIWLLSGAAVLVMGILALGWFKSLDRRVQAPAPVEPSATPAPTTPVALPTPEVPAALPANSIKLASIEEKKPAFFRPEPARRDFRLEIEFVGANTGENMLPSLKEDAELSLVVSPEEDVYLSLWTLSPDGSATQLYPLAGKEPTLVKAGEKQSLPDGLVYKVNFLGDAPERIWILASSHAWDVPSQAKANNVLLEYTSPGDADGWEKNIRGEILKSLKKESSARVCERILQYVVVKK
jgi:hypothetical protein